MYCYLLFAGDNSFAGANRSASATVDAGIGVDVIDVAFRDGANGAFGETCAASNTFVGDYVSHCSVNFKNLRNYVLFVGANLHLFSRAVKYLGHEIFTRVNQSLS